VEVSGGPDMAGLDRQIGFVLRLAQVAVFKDLLAALTPFEFRLADFSALLVIEANPGLKQQALGEALRIKRPNLVAIIDQLEERGLVQRGAVPGDRRSYALSLTPAGVALLQKAKAAHRRHEGRVLAALGPTDTDALLGALQRIAALDDA
jgi:DNA-binding MarR family transcriptional regulator